MFETAPLEAPMEITGPMRATLWAATDAKDSDWNVMLLAHPSYLTLPIIPRP